MQGWRKRMEDSHISDINIANRNIHLFGVFDGHGGMILSNVGKEVAQYVKRYFTEEFVNSGAFKSGNFKSALVENFLRMDQMVSESTGKIELKNLAKISKQEDDLNNKDKNPQTEMFKIFFDPRSQEDCDIALMTGCTATVCCIDQENNKLYFANAGDSRMVLCKNGVAYPMSIDHKPDLDTEKNRIYKADGYVSEGRVKGNISFNIGNLNLSRSLGDLEYKQNKKLAPEDQMITAYPDVVVENLTEDCDFIVLACDGVWDCMTNQEVCDFIMERLKKDPTYKLSKIIEEIFDQIVAPDIMSGKYFYNL